MIYFTSDTHFGHKNIIKYQPETRGHFTSVDEMDDTLISNWNAHVTPQDTVYHLGDFAFTNQGRIREILNQLNGTLHIVTGNHDKALRGAGLRKNLIESDLVAKFHGGYYELKVNRTLFVLNHYAQRVWNKSHYGSIHLYGHSHGSLDGIGKSVDVGVDSYELAEYTDCSLCPWSHDVIMEFMDSKTVSQLDHHKIKEGRK